MPLFAISCIPITIYQAASVSIDSMIFGLGILTIAYFIRLYLLKEFLLLKRKTRETELLNLYIHHSNFKFKSLEFKFNLLLNKVKNKNGNNYFHRKFFIFR